jgi:two-component system, cell cycle sensor histidine kinase and response regulator CckA
MADEVTPRTNNDDRMHAALLQSLRGIVWEADGDTFQFTFVSNQAEEILGFPASEWLADPDFWRRHTHPEDVARASTLCLDATRNGRDHEFEYRMVARDGRVVWLHDIVTVCPPRPDGRVILRGIMLDITERRRLEDDLVASRALLSHTENQLLQSQKMEALGRLAGGIAHDFNNLLTVISAYSELLIADIESGKPSVDDVEEIRRAADRASVLTQQLLAFSRKQVIRPDLQLVDQSVQEISRMLDRLLGVDVQLVLDLAAPDARVMIDSGQLHQIVMNLAVNARDAMPYGGKLTIATRTEGNWLLLGVSDTGVGMSEEVRSRIYEPFFTTKESGRGTGLGLSTVFGVVQQAHGTIDVRSKEGAGTTFEIRFPLSRSQRPASNQKTGCAGATILVVDADRLLTERIARILSDAGHRVLTASDRTGALQLTSEHENEIGLLVTDVVLPGLPGPALAERLEKILPSLRTLYLTAHQEGVIAQSGMLENGVGFLRKPFSDAELVVMVDEILAAPGAGD